MANYFVSLILWTRNPDGAMRALLRIIDREPAAARRALAR
jgi:hypothetical protein